MAEKREREAIDRLIAELYSSICFEKGEQPPLDILERVFLPEGKMIKNDGPVPESWTAGEYIERFQHFVTSGQFESFHEIEIAHTTELFGTIAHRFSTYETRVSLDDPEPFSMGINSIQLLKTGGSWFVSCMIWNSQTDERRIPQRYF